jgi:DNA-directed RNA polymerase specialized sigma24 family protein
LLLARRCRPIASAIGSSRDFLASYLKVSSEDDPLTEVQDARVRETSLLEALYRTKGPVIWRALLAFSTDPAVADDALSEAFVQLLARGDEVRDPLRWVWRTAFRIAAGELQERRRTTELRG